MTIQERVSATDTGLPEGVTERLEQFAEWTGTKPPTNIIELHGGAQTFTTEFLNYAKRTGLSLDWVWLGSPRSLVMGAFYAASNSSDDDDPLPAMLQEWIETRDRFNSHPGGDDNPKGAALMQRHGELCCRLMTTPPKSMAGAAALVSFMIEDDLLEFSQAEGLSTGMAQHLKSFLERAA